MDDTHPGREAAPPLPHAVLPEWAARREAGHLLLVEAWFAVATACLVAGLVSARFLLAPVLLAVVTAGTTLTGVVRDRWWRARRRLAGHPMARAAAPRTLARARPQPQGWPETVVMGALHVTGHGWRWVPSVFCTDDVSARAWRHEEVTGLRFEPSWGPGLPRSGYVRLTLAGGGVVDLLVWDPEVLGLLAGA
jgi:hypothetical protein